MDKQKVLFYKPVDSAMTYIWALLLPCLLSMLITVIFHGYPADTDGTKLIFKEAWFLCMLRLLSAGLLVGLFFVYNKVKNISVSASGIKIMPNYLGLLFALVLGVGMVFLADPVITMIASGLDKLGLHVPVSVDLPLNGFGDYLLALLMIGVLPAVTEELVFRGMICEGLRKYGKWTSILLSAAMFSLMHGVLAQLPFTFMLGIVLGYVMHETGSLILCMFLHFVNNMTVITSMYINAQNGVDAALPTGFSGTEIAVGIIMFLAAIGLAALMFYFITRFCKYNRPPEVPVSKSNEVFVQKENKTAQYLLIFGFILAIVFVVIQSI